MGKLMPRRHLTAYCCWTGRLCRMGTLPAFFAFPGRMAHLHVRGEEGRSCRFLSLMGTSRLCLGPTFAWLGGCHRQWSLATIGIRQSYQL